MFPTPIVSIAPRLSVRLLFLTAVETSLAVDAALTAPTREIGTAGALSLLVGIICTGVAFAVAPRRLAAVLCGGGIVLAAVALPGAAPSKGPLASAVGATLPHLVFPVVGLISSNTLAYLLLPAIAGAAAMGRGASRRSAKVTWAALATLGLVVLGVTGSRSSMVALLLSLALIAALSARNPSPRRLALLIVGTTSLLLLTGLLMWNDEALVLRRSIWSQVRTEAVGFGQFALNQTGNNPVLAPDYPPYNVHNAYLQTYLDFGLLGAVGMVMLLVVAMASLARALHRNREQRDLTVGALAALIALLAIGITESVFSTAYPRGHELVVVVSPVPQIVIAFALAVGRDHQDPLR